MPERRIRDQNGRPGLMHVKAAVSDGRTLLLSSANLTGDGLERNMELGLRITGSNLASQVEHQIDALMATSQLIPVVR